jgi:hypothetical protein
MGARGRDSKALLMIRYEDLYNDPEGELKKAAEFLTLDGSPQRIQAAVAAAQSQVTPEPPGRWRAVLPELALRTIESVWGPLMTEVGYTLESNTERIQASAS